jgi:hypothetical protein
VVSEVLTDVWQVDEGFDAQGGKSGGISDTRVEEDLGGPDSPCGKDDFLRSSQSLERPYDVARLLAPVRKMQGRTNLRLVDGTQRHGKQARSR